MQSTTQHQPQALDALVRAISGYLAARRYLESVEDRDYSPAQRGDNAADRRLTDAETTEAAALETLRSAFRALLLAGEPMPLLGAEVAGVHFSFYELLKPATPACVTRNALGIEVREASQAEWLAAVRGEAAMARAA